MIRKSLKTVTFTIAALTSLMAGTAFAQRPANIANTTWTRQTNVDVETLVITSQGGPGAPGAANCRIINGDIGNVAHIRGWYCPATGRIHFVHRNFDSGDAVRIFTGNLSDLVNALFMASTMMVRISAFGDLGEHNFSGAH